MTARIIRAARRRATLGPNVTLIQHNGAPHFADATDTSPLASVRLRSDTDAIEQRLGVDQPDPRS